MADEVRIVDTASNILMEKAAADNVTTAFDRSMSIGPHCKFGQMGVCCRNCNMGPCRIIEGKEGKDKGVCGATSSTIVARNFARGIVGGAAAHSDHGRAVAETLLMAATGEAPDYQIKDPVKLRKIAGEWGIDTEGREVKDIAKDVAESALEDFGRYHGHLNFVKRAPKPLQEKWEKWGVTPRAIDREIVEIMHRTSMGVDQDYRSIMRQAVRASLADGWGGSMIGTELQDVLFGTPAPVRGKINLGVLKDDHVNVIVHGHEPVLSEIIALASQAPDIVEKAKAAGAQGIVIAGICCTANEMLIRHGIPVAGNMMQQELAIATGAIEAMIVDVQCIMAGVVDAAKSYHTKIITTSPRAQITGAQHVEFDERSALETAKEVLGIAIDNYKNRGPVLIPEKGEVDMVAGFSHEAIEYMLGGRYRTSYRPLNDNIINGRIRGVAGVVGCNNPKVTVDALHTELVKELIKNNILVLQTGCSALACGKYGLLLPEMQKLAGDGLREVCETVGMPPVLHAGSCVDNSRILMAATAMVNEGGLGDDISQLPVAGAAPEWMHEKALSIAQYFVASGVFTVIGIGLPITGSPMVEKLLYEEMEEMYGGMWAVSNDPHEMAQMMIEHIEKKRDELGINVEAERKLYGMEDRRHLEV